VPRPADTPDPDVPALAAEEDTTGPLADGAPAPAGGEPAVAVVEPAAALPEPAPGPEPAATPAARTVPAPPVAAASPAPAGEWLVQLGSFAQRDNASRLAAAVRARGFAADVSETGGGGGRLYRVRVGPATTREAADARARDLSAAGYRGSVTRR
jgi:DedD protein